MNHRTHLTPVISVKNAIKRLKIPSEFASHGQRWLKNRQAIISLLEPKLVTS